MRVSEIRTAIDIGTHFTKMMADNQGCMYAWSVY